jgi:hypothetical protein
VENVEQSIEIVRVLIDMNNITAARASDSGSDRSQGVFPLQTAILGDNEWIGSWPNY